MEIVDGQIVRHDLSNKARGGTELLAERMVRDLPQELLQGYQIIFSRPQTLLNDKSRILYLHDLPNDPSSASLANEGWRKYSKLVFVSQWQMEQYIAHFDIPYSKCVVIKNSIDPIYLNEDKIDKDRKDLIYYSTPHRGLQILIPVFKELKKHHNLHLTIFSSFDLYGWPQRDEPFKRLFEAAEADPDISYSGSVPNEKIREELSSGKYDILAYPNIWPETSCLVLMEAMYAGLTCVHPNFGALPETAANWTHQYQFEPNIQEHAQIFYSAMMAALENYDSEESTSLRLAARSYAHLFYNWQIRQRDWIALLSTLRQDNELVIQTS